MKQIDKIFKELSLLYEFNKRIQKFKLKEEKQKDKMKTNNNIKKK